MVEKDGKQVPFFCEDDGMARARKKDGKAEWFPKTKGYFKGGRTMKNKMDTKGRQDGWQRLSGY